MEGPDSLVCKSITAPSPEVSVTKREVTSYKSMFGNVDRDELRRVLGLEERYEILMVLALGKPKEEVRLVPLGADGDIRYYRDADGVHYVPKRSLEEIILG